MTKEVSYTITILFAVKIKNTKIKCEPISTSVNLNSNEPWDTLKAQVLMKISNAIKPHVLNFDDYALILISPSIATAISSIMRTLYMSLTSWES